MGNILESKKLKDNQIFFIFLQKKNKLVPIDDLYFEIDDLKEINEQKKIVLDNTVSFSRNGPANNILLWGAKGMGKSTLVKSAVCYVNKTSKSNIKLVEVLNNEIGSLAEIIYELGQINSKFIIFIDDISFRKNENDFRLFKSLVEGSLLSHIKNVRFYVTSNLRHLSHKGKDQTNNDIEEKEISQNLLSLSDRFGCWVGFFDSSKEQYLEMVKYYFSKLSLKYSEKEEKLALEWSIEKGNFSGRTAFQFAYGNKINKK